MNSVSYAKRTQHKPIDILFRGVFDVRTKSKKALFVDAVEVLNDSYLGRLDVCNYFAVADNSVRVNELNLIGLTELKNYHLVMKENYYIPDNTVYCMPVSISFLSDNDDFDSLMKTLKENGYKKGSIVLAFHGAMLEGLDEAAKKRYMRLRRSGYKTAVANFGDEYNSLDVLAGFAFDYLRCDAKYFDASQNKKKLLAALLRFCGAAKLIMDGVDSPAQLARFKRAGVKYATGKALSPLLQWVTNEMLGLSAPSDEKLTAYNQKLKKELDARQRAELAELTKIIDEDRERIKNASTDGIAACAPRPSLDKSPYMIRLEQQREDAHKSAELLFAKEKNIENNQEEVFDDDDLNNTNENIEDGGEINAPLRPQEPVKNSARNKNVKADIEKQAKLLNEYRTGGLFDDLGGMGGMRGFGVTLHIDTDDIDTPPLEGSYNEKGQWVDTDGNVFNGYFDAEGNWIEYEKFDLTAEGSYNEFGQWVDTDRIVYDGYFDEERRWIDYSYTDANGEIVDNGYFDDKIGKWVPFGYFDKEGKYHRF